MRSLNALLHDRRASAGLFILLGLCVVALAAPLLAPTSPIVQDDVLRTRLLPQVIGESLDTYFHDDPKLKPIVNLVFCRLTMALETASSQCDRTAK